MAILGIVAVAKNLAIGKGGKLPWHYSADLKFFKQTTLNHAVVMGWKTWRSIGKPLPNRLNIVLSRANTDERQPSVLIMRSREEVLAIEKYLNCDLCVIGGASVFELFRDHIRKWNVTEIPLSIEGADVFMPENFLDGFALRQAKTLDDNLTVKIFERATKAL